MKNIKLTIEYDGTRFNGWQKQPNQLTIQGEVELALERITQEPIRLFGAGRTDRGVHARGQVANFQSSSSVPPKKFSLALNSLLPSDIAIFTSEAVEENFHSRYDAKGKEYRYLIINRKSRSSLYRNYAYHIPYPLDIRRMRAGAQYFIGTHDFKGFMSQGSSVKDTTRRIYSLSLEKEGSMIMITIRGNGFLYNMVRIIVGTLVSIGRGKMNPEDIPRIIETKDRRLAGETAPPQGLYLERVFYDTHQMEKILK